MIQSEPWFRVAGPSDELERLRHAVERDPRSFDAWVQFIRAGDRMGNLGRVLEMLPKPLVQNVYNQLEDRVQGSPSPLTVELFWKLFTNSWDVIKRTGGAYPDVPIGIIMQAPEDVQVGSAWIEGEQEGLLHERLDKHVPKVLRRMREFVDGEAKFDNTGFVSLHDSEGRVLVVEDRISDLKKLLAWAERL